MLGVLLTPLLFSLVRTQAHNPACEDWTPYEFHTPCCSQLEDLLPGRIFYSESSTFNQSLSSYYSNTAGELRPSCILRPQSTDDVATAVRLLSSQLSASEQDVGDCRFAVRGGGHTAWKGSNNIEGGVTIDLGSLNDISLSSDHSVVTFGGGNTWDKVYKYIEPYGLATHGGRVTGVGVGGLTLGGGISFYSSRYGFVCDNLESVELVMADGKVVNVSQTNHPDLFRALKGGTSNYGIATHLRMNTFKGGDFWGGQVFYNMSTADKQLEAVSRLADSKDYDPYGQVIQSYVWTPNMTLVSTVFTYTKVPASNSVPEFLAEMVKIPSFANTTRVAPYSSFTDELGKEYVAPRVIFATMTFRASESFAKQLYKLVDAYAAKLLPPTIPGFQTAITLQPLPQILTSKGTKNGGNVLGFTPEDGNVVNAILTTYWDDAADDDKVQTESERLIEEAQKMAKEAKVNIRALYLNYAAKWQDPIGGYGEDEVQFLKEMSTKYDPNGVFQKGIPGGYKVFGKNGSG
ncbi:unnamed protein product [Zymoseptoria tritici ST99CH_3D7]|uniref:FAD-binding PCMH-type domain-containing protein n=1 Tax=Zymoseptoria tritici (strain ST99CH_3D7) TaxID=1276538 RepID=A0A1X7RQA6_ZYMT9|nr:unnamed protein product [Zymoseptoria tritici ST99CH_3D7]